MTVSRAEVAVLGPLQFSFLAQPFRRTAARELVAYLAVHRDGVGAGTWSDALWPSRSVSQATIHSTVSDARRALGHEPDGMERLPRRGRQLQLADSVTTDVERFAHLASGTDARSWSDALSLVRGPFLDGLVLTDWAVFDGTRALVESMVVTTALKGAEDFLLHGCGAEAEDIVRRALRVSPYDERLYRALLWAVDAQGNRAALKSTMGELLALAGEGGAWDGVEQVSSGLTAIHPRTVSLYRRLACRSMPATRR